MVESKHSVVLLREPDGERREWEWSPGCTTVIDNAATYNLPLSFTCNGTSVSPVFIVGSTLSTSNRTQLDCGGDTGIQGTYFVMEWLNFRPISSGSFFVGFQGNVNHGAIRNCAITGIAGSQPTHAAIQCGFSYLGNFTRNWCVFYNNAWSDMGLVATTNDVDAHGLKFDSPATNCWVLDSTFDRIGGDSVQSGPQGAGAQGDWSCNHIYIGRNVTQGNRQSGYFVKHARDVVISQNTAFNQTGGASGASTPGTGAGLQEEADRVWYLFNHFYDCSGVNGTTGINCVQFSELFNQTGVRESVENYLIGNVIHDCSEQGIFCQQPESDAFYVVGNTVYNTHQGIVKGSADHTTTVHSWNNILDSIDSSGYHIWFNDTVKGTVKNNIFGRHGAQTFRIRSTDGTTYTGDAGFTAWQSQFGTSQSNNFNVNPNFVDPNNITHANRNYRLQTGSPGIDSGLLITSPKDVYARFQTLYGLSISVDFTNLARPQNTFWDIGAFELSGSSDTTPPTVTITAPTASPTLATNVALLTTLAGTASDNVGVTSVTWVNNRGGSGTAVGTTAWSVPLITLFSGDNVLTVTAFDAASNSAVDTLTVTFTDITAPIVTINTPTSSPTFSTSNATLAFAGTASDDVAVSNVTYELVHNTHCIVLGC